MIVSFHGRTHSRKLALAVSLVLSCAAATAAKAQTIPSDAQNLCPVSSTTFNGWFASGTPTLNGLVVPADSTKLDTSSNCNFYTWSEQMFLWLTSPTNGQPPYGGSGHVFTGSQFFQVVSQGSNRVFVPLSGSNGPLNVAVRTAQVNANGFQEIFDNHHVPHEIQPTPMKNGKPLIRNAAGKLVPVGKIMVANGKANFADTAGKPIMPQLKFSAAMMGHGPLPVQEFKLGNADVFLDSNNVPIVPDQGQAGGGGVLIGYRDSADQLVYYTTFANDVYAYYLSQIKNSNPNIPYNTPPGTEFPVSGTQAESIVAYAQSAYGAIITDPNALAMEIKASWVEVTPQEAPNYVTIQAIVPVYQKSSTQWTLTTQTRPATLGLLGLHVVGSTHGHPEMLWSTFEHMGDTPNAAYSYVNSAGATVPVPQGTDGTWLFCANSCASTPLFNDELAVVNSSGNIVQPTPPPSLGIGPSNTIRWHAWGAASDQPPNPTASAAQSNSQVISVNNNVMSQIINGDVRKNYMFVGSVWTNGGVQPDCPYPNPSGMDPTCTGQGNEVGTSQLSNSTMETYQQGTTDNTYGTYGNCFQCHNQTTPTGNPNPSVQISHVWNSLLALPLPGSQSKAMGMKKKAPMKKKS